MMLGKAIWLKLTGNCKPGSFNLQKTHFCIPLPTAGSIHFASSGSSPLAFSLSSVQVVGQDLNLYQLSAGKNLAYINITSAVLSSLTPLQATQLTPPPTPSPPAPPYDASSCACVPFPPPLVLPDGISAPAAAAAISAAVELLAVQQAKCVARAAVDALVASDARAAKYVVAIAQAYASVDLAAQQAAVAARAYAQASAAAASAATALTAPTLRVNQR